MVRRCHSRLAVCAVASLVGCHTLTGRVLGPIDAGLSEREGAATATEGRLSAIVSADWEALEIAEGAGSCWGEGASPVLYAVRDGDGAGLGETEEEARRGEVRLDSTGLRSFRAKLFEFTKHFAEYGTATANYFVVHAASVKQAGESEFRQIFYGYWTKRSRDFESWLREIYPSIKPLRLEREERPQSQSSP